VALLVGGLEDGRPRLYETDPSGTPYEWQAIAIGSDRGGIQEYLEGHYDPELKLTDAVGLALEALESVSEGGLRPDGVGAATVDAESGQYLELTNEEIRTYLESASLLPEETG
ncbi:MAG: proteasome subunit alpha, partial [Halodesulfurarchaeum sp.]